MVYLIPVYKKFKLIKIARCILKKEIKNKYKVK